MQSSSSNLANQGPNMNITLFFVVENFRCFLKASRCLRHVIEIIQWVKSKKKRIYRIYLLQHFRNLAIAKPSRNYFSHKTLEGKWLRKKLIYPHAAAILIAIEVRERVIKYVLDADPHENECGVAQYNLHKDFFRCVWTATANVF